MGTAFCLAGLALLLASHQRLREGFKEERTSCINRIRGLLAEFGVVLSQSPDVLRHYLGDVIEDASNDIAGISRLVLQRVDFPLAGDVPLVVEG